MIKKTFQAPKPPVNPGRRRTSLQLNTDLIKVKKEHVVRSNIKVQYANPNETDEKGITPLIHLVSGLFSVYDNLLRPCHKDFIYIQSILQLRDIMSKK